MKINLLVIFHLILTVNMFGQNKIPGLYGKCDGRYRGYICQQVLFNSDSTFEFYDLLHLRGWTVSKGVWKEKGDTIILTSTDKFYDIAYFGESDKNDLTLKIIADTFPAFYAKVYVDTITYKADSNGIVKIPKNKLDRISVSFILQGVRRIKLDIDRAIKTDVVEIVLYSEGKNKINFFSEKWILRDQKLYHTSNENNEYDDEKYFEKTTLNDLKYHK